MSLLRNVHHINFVVADLEAATKNYERMLGVGPFEFEDLPDRDVVTARVQVGNVWIVLVHPKSGDGVAGRYLKEHGEGFFLMSFGVDDLDEALLELSKRGAVLGDNKVRNGILDWRVADLNTDDILGVRFHLTQTD